MCVWLLTFANQTTCIFHLDRGVGVQVRVEVVGGAERLRRIGELGKTSGDVGLLLGQVVRFGSDRCLLLREALRCKAAILSHSCGSGA